MGACLSSLIYEAIKSKAPYIDKCCGGFLACQPPVCDGADALSRQGLRERRLV